MISEKLESVINGHPHNLTSQEVIELGTHCAAQNLSLDALTSISLTLFKESKTSCYEFLQFIEKHQINNVNYRDFIHQPSKIKIYNNLAALTLGQALREYERGSIEKKMNESRKYLISSQGVKNTIQKNIILFRGFLLYYNAEFGKANNIFIKAFDDTNNEGEPNLQVPALLGLAQINFIKKSYAKALEFYKKAMMAKKSLPVHARLGMGYCFYELQKYQLAELCFRKIIKIDPKCGSAYMGLAVIRSKAHDFSGYFSNLQLAYRLDPDNPCVLLHLSEHLFFLGDKQKTLKLCEKGLEKIKQMPKFLKCEEIIRNDFQMYRARFNNLIAQVHHMNGEFQTALKYYQEAKGQGLNFNDLGMAQIYIHANMLKQALNIYQNIFNNISLKDSKLIGDHSKTLAYLQMKTGKHTVNDPNFYFKQAIKFNKNDYEARIDYSVYLTDRNNKQKALIILQEAKEILQTDKKNPSPELLNNIGVYYLENKEATTKAIKILESSVKALGTIPQTNPAEQLRYNSLYLICNFNLAIGYERANQFSKAIQIHENLIGKNKYYMDSYSRLGIIHFKHLGNRIKAIELLDKALEHTNQIKNNNSSSKLMDMLRLDKVMTLKAHFLHLDNRNGEAKQILRKMGKKKFTYENFYEMCLGYETVMKKNLQMMVIKDFLRPNRQYCINICQHQSHNLHSHMMLVILLLTDQKITHQQAILFFNQLKVAEFQFPEILLNFGIFLLTHGDYDGALFSLNRYLERTRSLKTYQYIALAQLLQGDYQQCIKTVRKMILVEPNNLKYRFQYAYTIQKWVQKLYEEQSNFKDLKATQATLIMCRQLYIKLNKVYPVDYIKHLSSADLKQKIKNEISKIRGLCEDRKRFVQSQLEYYMKKKGDILEKEKRILDEERRQRQQLQKAKQTKELLDKLEEEMNEEDQEKQKERKRRQRLVQMSRIQSEKASKVWAEIEEKAKQENQEKKSRKTQGKRQRKPKKEEIIEKIPQEQGSQESFKEFISESDEELNSSEKKKKKKEKKRSKKQRMKEKRRRKQKRDAYQSDENQSNDDKNFDDNSLSYNDDDEDGFERQKPQKERKVQKQEEDDEMDIGDYLLD